MLSQIPDEVHRAAAQAALLHHERLDGSGYMGLRDDKIPLFARIIAVADVYDALVSDRPYREGWKKDDALGYVQQNTGNMFDTEVVKALTQSIQKEKQPGEKVL